MVFLKRPPIEVAQLKRCADGAVFDVGCGRPGTCPLFCDPEPTSNARWFHKDGWREFLSIINRRRDPSQIDGNALCKPRGIPVRGGVPGSGARGSGPPPPPRVGLAKFSNEIDQQVWGLT